MEISNQQGKCHEHFTVRQLYDIRQRNYDWESFKYVLPRKYPHSATSSVKSGSLFCTKNNYLDELQKKKKTIPGPSHYKYSTNSLRPTSGKMDKGDRKTMSEQIKCKSIKENHPGPGAYFKRPKSALTIMAVSPTNKNKRVMMKKHYLNQVEYLAAIMPGVGAYNLTRSQHVPGPRMQKKGYKKSKKDKENEEKNQLINTNQFVKGTFDWMKSQSKSKDSNFFGRSTRFATDLKSEKKPAPNKYKINSDWNSKENWVSMTCSSNSNLKTVYYH